MSIRKKTLTIVGMVVITLVTALTAASYILVTEHFAHMEDTETERLVQRILNDLTAILSQLESTAGDWAPWDETYRSIEDGDPAFVENNLLDATLNNLKLNFMLFYHAGGKLVFSKYYEPNPEQPTVHAEKLLAAIGNCPPLFNYHDEKSQVSGIVMTPSMPFLVAAHPIVTSDFKGPIRGTLIIGRALDTEEIARLAASNQTHLTVTPLAAPKSGLPSATARSEMTKTGIIGTRPVDQDRVTGYVTISDLSDTPALLLEITRNRDIYRYGLTIWRHNAMILAGVSLAVIGLLMLLLDRIILNRLGDLTESVMQIAHCANRFERLDVKSGDEIGRLAEGINAMLEALQDYHKDKLDNENYLRQLLDSINCGVMVVDAETHRVVDINKAGVTLFAGPKHNIIGELCHQLICPNEAGNCPVTDQGKAIDLSNRQLLRYDGTAIPVLKSVTTTHRRGRTFLIESFIDIGKLQKTEANLRASEERYRRFFEEDITGDFLVSLDGRIIDCNPAFAKMFGFNHPEEVIAITPVDRYLPKEIRGMLVNRLQSEGRLIGIELEFIHRNGHPLYCIGNLIGQFDDNGMLREIKGYLFDDTKRVHLERGLRRAQKMEAIGTLAGGIAHDFNNILAGIMGYTEIAISELPEDHAAVARMQMVIKSANRAKDLVHQILAFSRQTEGESQPLCVNPIIKEVAKLMRSSLPTTIEIREELESTAKILANPVQIHQMLMNLCTNAGYAMKKQGGRLTLSVTNTILDKNFTDRHPGVRQGAYLRIRVEDTGPGIAPDVVDRIFDPFFTTKNKNEGTGLGLSVVHGIVSKLKGAIAVTSNHQGSRFDTYLPIVEDAAPSAAPKPAALPSGCEAIVLIDDEELLVEIGTHVLGSLGYRVTGFTDSQKALAHIQASADPIDLVITDMTMPGLTGLALAKQLRRSRPQLPVILCTGYSEDISEQTAQEMGINGFVMKPMVIKELAAEIRKVLDTHLPITTPAGAAGA